MNKKIVLTSCGIIDENLKQEFYKLLNKEIKNSFIPSQFSNPANVNAHYFETAKEIYEDLDGNTVSETTSYIHVQDFKSANAEESADNNNGITVLEKIRTFGKNDFAVAVSQQAIIDVFKKMLYKLSGQTPPAPQYNGSGDEDNQSYSD